MPSFALLRARAVGERPRARALAGLICAVFTCLVVLVGLSPPALAQVAPQETWRPPMQALNQSGERANLPLADEIIHTDIDGQHASTTLRHIYDNSGGGRLEGRFSMKTDDEVHVSGFSYWNGEQKIVGEVFERETATQIYQQTVNRRRDPGLLVQDGAGRFSFRVFPIEPGERKRVELMFDQWLTRRGNDVEYRAPVASPTAEIDVVIKDARGVGNIVSPSHAIKITRSGNGRVRVRATRSHGDTHEFVLRYQIVDKPWAIAGYVHRDPGEDAYVLLSLAAPHNMSRAMIQPKDVTLVIDRSGSMAGEPLRQAKRAAASVLARLGPKDRLNVIMFDTNSDLLFDKPVPASTAARQEAQEFIERVLDGGGTDIAGALGTALLHQHHAGPRPRVVLFVTDGQSDAQTALKVAHNDNNDVRVFTVGVGEGVEKPLLSRLAHDKRGRFTYIENPTTLEQRVWDLYASIEAPVLVNVSIHAEGGRVVQVYPPRTPDLFRNDELRVVARVKPRGNSPVRFTIRGRLGNRDVQLVRDVRVPHKVRRTWVGKQWARARIDYLQEEIALSGMAPELKSEVLDLSLAYNIVTPYSAFLAIPESELTAGARQILSQARADKQRVMSKHRDATALLDPSATPRHGPTLASRSRTRHASKMDSAVYDFEDDGIDGELLSPEGANIYSGPAMAVEDEDAPELAARDRSEGPRTMDGKAGCASCTTHDPGDRGAVWALALLGLLGARRRRRPAA